MLSDNHYFSFDFELAKIREYESRKVKAKLQVASNVQASMTTGSRDFAAADYKLRETAHSFGWDRAWQLLDNLGAARTKTLERLFGDLEREGKTGPAYNAVQAIPGLTLSDLLVR